MFFRIAMLLVSFCFSAELFANEATKLTVAAVFQQKDTIAGKVVQVEGKVVKVNKGIMGKNWVHIQDGTGSEAKKDHDITCTTTGEPPEVGATVRAKGTAVKDQKFMMYEYAVLLENTSFEKI